MPIEVLMPALSPTMTEGNLAKWHKRPGDKVKAGDILAEIETDKATMEMEAVDEGTFAKIIVPEGTDHVAVNLPIAVIAGEDESVEDAAKAEAAPPPRSPATASQAPAAAPAMPAAAPSPAPAQPRPVPLPAAAEWTGATANLTVREALRDAVAEEMRRDETVFLM